LEKVEKLKEKRKKANEFLDEYLKSVFSEMFLEKGFKEVELGTVCEKITDGPHRTPQLINKGYSFFTVANMRGFDFDYTHCKKISQKDFDDLVKNGCQPVKGDVLFSKDGTVGKVMRINNTKDQVILSSIAILRPKENEINQIYLEHALKSDITLNQAINLKSGSAIRRIILRQLKSIKIPLPPIAIQNQFAKIVEKVEKIKQRQKESKQEIDNLFNALMQKAFCGELV